MSSVASQLIEEVTAHAQSDSLEDAREMCADGTYFPNNLRIYIQGVNHDIWTLVQEMTCWVFVVKKLQITIFPILERKREGKDY